MTKEEVIAEINKLEAEAKQMIANFMAGAIHAYRNVLASLEAAEEKVVETIKEL